MTRRWILFAHLIALPLSPAAFAAKPEYHTMWVPPGKTARDMKPQPQARADAPVVLELRAHRHADGSLHFECDHLHPAPGSDGTKDKGQEP